MQFATTALRTLARSTAHSSRVGAIRALHATASRSAFSKFAMPAMSPTMTEGGLANWKVKEGAAFSAGDVLLEIETDKATMDVEAQDDGVMAKIIIQAGEKGIQVGKTIAILAEEGDDLSKAESEVSADQPAPKAEDKKPAEEPKQQQQSSQPQAGHSPAASKPAGSTGHGDSKSQKFPSVSRLLAENNISDDQAAQIKGTGVRGMLTKGDILVHLGKASSPTGSYDRGHPGVTSFGGAPPPGKGPAEAGANKSGSSSNAPSSSTSSAQQSPSAVELRSAILAGLAAPKKAPSAPKAASAPVAVAPTPAQVLSDLSAAAPVAAPVSRPAQQKDWLEGIL